MITKFSLLPLLLFLPLILAVPTKRSYPVPKTRFYLKNLQTAHYSAEDPVDPAWFGNVRNVVAKPEDLRPGVHPRVLTSRAEWDRIISTYANPNTFNKERTWSKSFLYLTKNNGPESEFIDMLAKLEMSGETAVFLGKGLNDFGSAQEYDAYRASLKGLADKVKITEEIRSHHLFLCAFWASISDKQGENGFLGKDITKKCVDASVAWAKILLSHRTYHCNPNCTATEMDAERSFLWNYEVMWSVSHDWYLVGSSLALSYDILYNKMNDEQRTVVRSAIATMVLKRWTWGLADENGVNNPNAETHPHRIFSNWATYHSNLYVTNLAIESENESRGYGYVSYVQHLLREQDATDSNNKVIGFNEKMNRKFDAVYKAFWDHSIYPDGSTFEDGYTFHTALREGSLGLLVAHRRGAANILNTPKFRNMIHHVAQQWEPKQCGHLIGHSSGGGLRYPSYVGFLIYAYPDGVLPRMVWAQRFGRDFMNTEECRIWYVQTMTQLAIFGTDHGNNYDEIADSAESLPEPWKSKFPLSYVATRRGLIISRGSHSQMTSYMHFDARPDSMFPGHDNADRGVITLSALKKIWLDDLDWEFNVESYKHSLMHIDGLAQAKKAPSVTILKVVDTKDYVIASADLSYPYNVQWAPAWQGPNIGKGTVTDRNLDGSYTTKDYFFTDREPNSPWDLGWPMEDDAKDIGFYPGMNLNPLMDVGFAGTIEWRRHYRPNPISHFKRSTIMIRSPKNGVGVAVLVDSVHAGAGAHTFESYLVLHDDVVLDRASKCVSNNCKIVLKQKVGVERVDVHVTTRATNLGFRLETFRSEEEDILHKRLILKTRGVSEEEFWIAFHPHMGDARGFEMKRDGDAIKFVYERDVSRFTLADDHTVVDADDDSSGADVSPTEMPAAKQNADNGRLDEATPSPVTEGPTDGSENVESKQSRPSFTRAPSPTATKKPTDGTPVRGTAPMQPLPLEIRGWQKVTPDMLTSISRASYFAETNAKHQIVFNITSRAAGKFGDRLQTCRGFTNAETRIRLYDCGIGFEAYRKYQNRQCELVDESRATDRCMGVDGGRKADFKRELEGEKQYFVVVDVFEGEEEARFLIGHKYYWTG